MRLLFACLALLLTLPAHAAQPSARAAYEAGDWTFARNLGLEADDAESMTYAAEAALAPLILAEMTDAPRSEKRIRARMAGDLARRALATDRDYARAHLALATALGYEARYSNPIGAALARLPQRGRGHIERALELDPASAWAHALMGAWHLEIVRRAGEPTFGADTEAGLGRYRAAAAIAESPAIPYHFALALLALDAEAHGDEAVTQLRAAAEMEADTAFDAALRSRAEALLEVAQTFRAAAAEEAVARLED